MRHSHRIGFVIAAAAFTAAAHAQTNQALFLVPWPETPQLAQTIDEPIWVSSADDESGSGEIDIFYWDSTGRVKLDRESQTPDTVIGYRVLNITVDNTHPELAGGYTEISIVGGFQLGSWKDWDFSLIVGGGVATDNHFSNGDAYFAIGDFMASTDFGDGRLHLGLRYDGNRNIFPDIPMPYGMYVEQTSPEFTWYVGLPGSGFVWKAAPSLVLDVSFIIPTSVQAKATYYITKDISLFAEYKSTRDGFWRHNVDDRRTFYRMHRITFGGRLVHGQWIDIAAGIGYAFEQKFSTGWDVRDTTALARPSDELLLYFAIRGSF